MNLRKTAKVAIAATLTVSASLMAVSPAFAYTPISEFTDLNQNHWAYRAVQALVEKYQVMEGFPDKTFRGSKTLTRYEFAAALARVMAKIDQMIAANQPAPGVSPDDLKTLAQLQVEFKKELAELKGRVDNLEERVTALEKIKLGGEVEARYRDRFFAVSNPAAPAAPLTYGPTANDATPNSPGLSTFNDNDALPIRVRTKLNVTAGLMPGVVYKGSFAADEMGFGMACGPAGCGRSMLAGGHFGAEGLTGSPFYVERSSIHAGTSWGGEDGGTASSANFHVGLMNFKDMLNPGTNLMNHFASESWIGHGYGLVGFGASPVASNRGAGNMLYRFWGSGIDASRVDPDSRRYNDVSAPSVALDTTLGPVKLFVGANYGSFYTNRAVATTGNLAGAGAVRTGADQNVASGMTLTSNDSVWGNVNPANNAVTSNLLDLPSQYMDGYGVAGLELDLGKPIGNDVFPVRMGVHAMEYHNDAIMTFSGTRKELSGVLDLGGDKFGLTLQANNSFSGMDTASAALVANDIFDSGLDLGLGGKASLFNWMGFDLNGASVGGYLVLPSFDGMLPRVMVAAQQGLGRGLFNATAAAAGASQFDQAGLTVAVPFNKIGGSGLDIVFEYNQLHDGMLTEFDKMVAQDLSVYTRYRF